MRDRGAKMAPGRATGGGAARAATKMAAGSVVTDDLSLYLKSLEQLEGEDRQNEAHDRHDAADVRNDAQGSLVDWGQQSRMDVHQHGEVGQVVAFAHCVSVVGRVDAATFF